jgi:hypothetical protein
MADELDGHITETWTFFDHQSRIQLILKTYGGCIWKASYNGHGVPSDKVFLGELKFDCRASQISTLRTWYNQNLLEMSYLDGQIIVSSLTTPVETNQSRFTIFEKKNQSLIQGHFCIVSSPCVNDIINQSLQNDAMDMSLFFRKKGFKEHPWTSEHGVSQVIHLTEASTTSIRSNVK